MMAVEGWILPVLDPDAGSSFDTLLDTLVPKDTDVEVIDLKLVPSKLPPHKLNLLPTTFICLLQP